MKRPRHHTLQGICQDVCVNYQQVVEVLRRIRQVCLEENGTVITQDAGTFFCRNVQGRSGVLNGRPWTSKSFIELGLKGERIEGGEHVETSELLFERIVVRAGVGFTNFEDLPNRPDDTFFSELNFLPGGVVGLVSRDGMGNVNNDFTAVEISRQVVVDGVDDFVEGYNDIEISLTRRIDGNGPPNGLGAISIGGDILSIDGVLKVEPVESLALQSTPEFDSLFFESREIGYQVEFILGTVV